MAEKLPDDLIIKGIRLPSGESSDILVGGGLIREVGPGLTAPEGAGRLEGGGRLALPACIDMHVHFRTPGGEHKETLLSGAEAAAKGGVATCADMPNTTPPTTTMERLRSKMALAGGAAANLLYNFGCEPDNLEQVALAAAEPQVKALKIYLGPTTGIGGLAPAAVEAHFRQAARLDLPVIVHAEDMESIAAAQGAFPHDVEHHCQLRSLEAELKGASQALGLAKSHGVRLYLAHCTSARVLELVRESGLGERALAEVCPHHLLLSTADIAPPAENRFKVNPPLRPPDEREALFAQLAQGVGCLGSDHAPHLMEEKERPYGEAPSGMPGVEYLLPIALNWWREGVITLERLIELTSARAARFFGLNKGLLEAGRDADIVLISPESQWRIGEGSDRIASRCRWSPYQGMAIRGRPEVTIAGGRITYPAVP